NLDSELHSSSEVVAWRETKLGPSLRRCGRGQLFKLKPLNPDDSVASLEGTILQRGSTRRFAPRSIPFEHLSRILSDASPPIPVDATGPHGPLIEIFLVANQVEDLPSGSYRFDREGGVVEQLKLGKFKDISGYLCLDQPLFADASAVLFLMADLSSVTQAFG